MRGNAKAILAVDIGNTTATAGLFQAGKLKYFSNMPVAAPSFDGFWKKNFRTPPGNVSDVVVCSVNPHALQRFLPWAKKKFGRAPLVVGGNLDLRIQTSYRRPSELGADRVVNAFWAARTYDSASIVVDFGTAVTFDCVGASKKYLGGIIAPGINLTRRALAEWTALLPLVEVTPGGPLIGKSTEEAINSGLFHGIVSMVDGLLLQIIKRLRKRPRIVATGGDGKHVTKKSAFIEKWIPDLTLQGLFLAWEDHVARHGG